MIERMCPCCQELFTPNKYHPGQEFCGKPGCRRASHAKANRKWRAKQRKEDPLRESRRKRRERRRERVRLCRELSQWRKQLAQQKMLLLGMLNLLGGAAAADLTKTISRCLDLGRDLLRETSADLGDVWENACPGSGFSRS